MNKRGTPENLVPSHPGNTNAARHGVHSPRLIQARASEIEADLIQSFKFSPTQRLALREVARCIAILDAIDRDLDDRGLVDKRGKPHYLLDHRYRISRQLDQWLAKISEPIERQAAAGQEPPQTEFADYVRALQRIALGQDPSGSARDRLAALKELVRLDTARSIAGTSEDDPEIQQRWAEVRRADSITHLENLERKFGIRK